MVKFVLVCGLSHFEDLIKLKKYFSVYPALTAYIRILPLMLMQNCHCHSCCKMYSCKTLRITENVLVFYDYLNAGLFTYLTL